VEVERDCKDAERVDLQLSCGESCCWLGREGGMEGPVKRLERARVMDQRGTGRGMGGGEFSGMGGQEEALR